MHTRRQELSQLTRKPMKNGIKAQVITAGLWGCSQMQFHLSSGWNTTQGMLNCRVSRGRTGCSIPMWL